MGVMAMKWPNRIAQGFSPGLAQRETALPVRRSSGNVGRRRKRATDKVPTTSGSFRSCHTHLATCLIMPDRLWRPYRALLNCVNHPGLKPGLLCFAISWRTIPITFSSCFFCPSRTHTPTRRHADTPTRRHADTPTRRHADTPTRRHADTPTRRHAHTPTRKIPSLTPTYER
jgi:hypothetical protein